MIQNNETYRDQYIKNKTDYVCLKEMEGSGIISSIKNKINLTKTTNDQSTDSQSNDSQSKKNENIINRVAIFIRKCNIHWNTLIDTITDKNGNYELPPCITKSIQNGGTRASVRIENARLRNKKEMEKLLQRPCQTINEKIVKENLTEKIFIPSYQKILENPRSFYLKSGTNKIKHMTDTIYVGKSKVHPQLHTVLELANPIVWDDDESYKGALNEINNYAKNKKIQCQPTNLCKDDKCEELFNMIIILKEIRPKYRAYDDYHPNNNDRFRIEKIIDMS